MAGCSAPPIGSGRHAGAGAIRQPQLAERGAPRRGVAADDGIPQMLAGLLIWCAVRRIKRPTGAHRGGGVADALGDLPGDLDLLLHAAARCYGYAAEQAGDRARPMVQERACSIS